MRLLIVKANVVCREQPFLSAVRAGPPILIRKVLCTVSASLGQSLTGPELTTPVIFAPSGKLNSFSSAAS